MIFSKNLIQYLEPFIKNDQALAAFAQTCKDHFNIIFYRLTRQYSVLVYDAVNGQSIQFSNDPLITMQFCKMTGYTNVMFQLGQLDHLSFCGITFEQYVAHVAFARFMKPNLHDQSNAACILKLSSIGNNGNKANFDFDRPWEKMFYPWQRMLQLVRSARWIDLQQGPWMEMIMCKIVNLPQNRYRTREDKAREDELRDIYFSALNAVDLLYERDQETPNGSREILRYVIEMFIEYADHLGDNFFIELGSLIQPEGSEKRSRIFSDEFTEECKMIASIIDLKEAVMTYVNHENCGMLFDSLVKRDIYTENQIIDWYKEIHGFSGITHEKRFNDWIQGHKIELDNDCEFEFEWKPLRDAFLPIIVDFLKDVKNLEKDTSETQSELEELINRWTNM